MERNSDPGHKGTAIDIVASVRNKGVKLWAQGGQLHFRGPKGALTVCEMHEMRARRLEIVALLEGVANPRSGEPELQPHLGYRRAPLSFSQLAHWKMYRLDTKPAIRQIAAAVRLRGRLDIGLLREALVSIACMQGALRTQVDTVPEEPEQKILHSQSIELGIEDLRTISERSRENVVHERLKQLILAPINVAQDPLWGGSVLRLAEDEHVLILVMEHMISDAFSRSIMLRDIFSNYAHLSRGNSNDPPAIGMQFWEYAERQRSKLMPKLEQHRRHWNDRLGRYQPPPFPGEIAGTTAAGWHTVPVTIDKELRILLREWCRRNRTTLAMGVLTAYVALVLRWCETAHIVIQYQSDGRTNPAIQNTVGYFASVLYFRFEIAGHEDFIDLMHQAMEEFAQATERADCAYVLIQTPRPQFTRATAFNWMPVGRLANGPDPELAEIGISASRVPFSHPMLEKLESDHDPSVRFFDTEQQIHGDILYPAGRFDAEEMARFSRAFMSVLDALLANPRQRITGIRLR